MHPELEALFDRQRGVANSGQILSYVTRRGFEAMVNSGVLERIWHGIYCRGEPDDLLRLRGLDHACGTAVPACLGTAAALHGFDTEEPADLHVLSPVGSRLRSADGLVVHRRNGVPLRQSRRASRDITRMDGGRGRAQCSSARTLATLDAALRSGTCQRVELWRAAAQQSGRRGIVAVRDLIGLADGLAESPMETEARLAMLDGGLPRPVLQYEILDGNGELRRVDFAWPEERVAVEYDGIDWRSGPEAMRHDRRRQAALQDVGWTVIPIVFEDVRYRAWDFVARIDLQLRRSRAA